MNVTLVIFSLVAGGAERVMSAFASHIAAKGWTANLLTLDSGENPPFYPLHPDVRHRALNLANVSAGAVDALRNNFRRIRQLRNAIRTTSPDIVISLMSETNVLTLLATRGLGVPVLVQEQNDPAQQPIARQWDTLRRWTYPRASHVILLTERSLGFFSGAVRKNARVIPNPAIVSITPRKPFSGDPASRTLMAMGRLVPQKGFDMLLPAFASIAEKHPAWTLEILGEGPLRPEFEALVDSLGMRGRIRLPGTTKQPHERLRTADLFVMSSRHEGFPLSLCEAMACGLPVVSFDCPTGPREIIREGTDGLLVPPNNVEMLAHSLSRLMADDHLRETLASRAPEVMERFGLPRVMEMWDSLILECVRPTELQPA